MTVFNKLCFAYPHGIGDCILFTPVLRELKKLGIRIGVGLDRKRAYASKVFENCPYVDDIYPMPCPHDFPDYTSGAEVALKEIRSTMASGGYTNGVWMDHTQPVHKIHLMFENLRTRGGFPELELPQPEDLYTEVFLTREDRNFAKNFVGNKKFTFVHGSSPSLPPKDFPQDFLEKLRREEEVIEVGVDFQPTDFDINKQFAILELADKVKVIDSAFYHAAHALGKDVDLAYFNRGKKVYDRVKPLHTVKENICYEI